MTRHRDPEIAAEWIRGAFGWIVILLVAILVIPVGIVAGIGFAQGTIPPGRPRRSDTRLSVFAHTTKGWMPWHPPLRLPLASPRVRYSASMTSRMRAAVSDGVFPTLTPAASRASFLACAVPAEPETIAPAWPIVLPSGAVKPAT